MRYVITLYDDPEILGYLDTDEVPTAGMVKEMANDPVLRLTPDHEIRFWTLH